MENDIGWFLMFLIGNGEKEVLKDLMGLWVDVFIDVILGFVLDVGFVFREFSVYRRKMFVIKEKLF